MARYIDAEKISSHIRESFSIDKTKNADICFAFIDFMNWLDEQPTADVVEVKHGEWETVVVYNDTCIATCSSCRQPIVERECNATAFKLENEFCRKCGAKMDGERRDAECQEKQDQV